MAASVQHSYFNPQTYNARDRNSIPRPATPILSFSAKNVKTGLELFCSQALQAKSGGHGHGRTHMLEGHKYRRRLNVRAAKRKESSRSFLMSSTLVAKEEDEHRVAELCQFITQWAKEKQKDRTSGIQEFGCFPDLYQKHTYHFMERYKSFQHITNTRSLPEYTKFMNDVRPLLSQPVQLAIYEYRDGQIGHMLNPIGPKGEGGLDDATGQGGIGGGVSHKQQSKVSLNLDMEEKKDRGEWSLKKVLEKVKGEIKGESDDEKSGKWKVASLFGKSEK